MNDTNAFAFEWQCKQDMLSKTRSRYFGHVHKKQLLDEVFVISRLRLITLTETLVILDITKTNLIIVLLYIERNKKNHVFASSLTASKTKRVNYP